ncbi:MFS general substrate transporter [Neoconidiobolus thromboides FSU 785]|nr:MFS general substrate transporter [Neoconidiobolus thromboides FSU 785]
MSRKELWTSYAGIFLISYITSLEGDLRSDLLNIALSDFQTNSLTSIFFLVTNLIGLILIPLYSKLTDYFGRIEMYFVALSFYLLGLTLISFANLFPVYYAGWLITNIGATGYESIKLIIIADLSSLANRANLSVLDSIPVVINSWVGSLLLTPISENLGWRWGSLIPIIAFVPCIGLFFGTMFYLQRKARRQTDTFISIKCFGILNGLKNVYNEIDIIGFVLLITSLIMILLPINIAGTLEDGWSTPSMIALMVVGGILFMGLLLWESDYAKLPLIPLELLKTKTTLGAILILSLSAMDAGLNWQYFYLYFMITRKLDPTSASLLFKGYQMCYLISGLITGILIKKNYNFKYILIVGAGLNCIALGTMISARFPHSSEVAIHATQSIAGIGQAILDICVVIAYQGSVNRKDVATITSIAQIFRGVSTAFGGTLAGMIWNQVIPEFINQKVKGEIDLTRTMNEISYVRDLPDSQFEQVVAAFGDGQMIISAISCGLAGLGFLIAIFMIKPIDVYDKQRFDGRITDD